MALAGRGGDSTRPPAKTTSSDAEPATAGIATAVDALLTRLPGAASQSAVMDLAAARLFDDGAARRELRNTLGRVDARIDPTDDPR